VACWSTLALGFADLARYTRKRASPSNAFISVFPLLSALTTLAGAGLVGAASRTPGASGGAAGVLSSMVVGRAAMMGIPWALVAMHTLRAGYGLAAAHCVADWAPRRINARCVCV
jgi:cytosine/uracil/thiamine/allantoin permease